MTWNFRLVKHTDRKTRHVWYGVHEVFYNGAGKPWAMTEDPISPGGESKRELLAELKMIRRDITQLPILDATRVKWAKPPLNLRRDKRKVFQNAKAFLRDLRCEPFRSPAIPSCDLR